MSEDQAKGVEKTQDLLIESACELFAAKGFDGTTVKDIADGAKVNVSLVSYHFKGKEGLYRTCLERFGKERLASAQRLLQPVENITEFRIRLGLFIDEIIGCHIDQPQITTMIHREREMGFPHAHDIFRDTFMKVFETLVEFFKTAQKNKVLRKDVDVFAAPALLFGGITHLSQNQVLSKTFFNMSMQDKEFQHRVRDQLLLSFADGLAVETKS